MVKFLLFFFLHPVVNRTDFCVSLRDGYSHPMINFVVLGIFLSRQRLTILLLSTSFRGKSPPVRFSTSLSVTSDFLLKPIGFFEGTCGRYFHSSSLIYKNNIRRQRTESTFFLFWSRHKSRALIEVITEIILMKEENVLQAWTGCRGDFESDVSTVMLSVFHSASMSKLIISLFLLKVILFHWIKKVQ